MKEKVVLAYSGGLDTSYCVKYLSEELGLEVYTALANTGGFTEAELKTVEKKAYALGRRNMLTWMRQRIIMRSVSVIWCSVMFCGIKPTLYR